MSQNKSAGDKMMESITQHHKLMDQVKQFTNPLGYLKGMAPLKAEIHIAQNYHNAEYQREVILRSIAEFEKSLDDQHEVALRLTSFGSNVMLSVEEIGFTDPSLIHFSGFVEGSPAHLVQHISQISFLILSVKKQDPQKPAKRIGFTVDL